MTNRAGRRGQLRLFHWMQRIGVPVVCILALYTCSSDDRPRPAPKVDSIAAAAPVDTHDEESSRVTLSELAYQTAGIQVEAVYSSTPAGSEDLEVPGQVEFDPRRVAIISPRAPGRIERLLVVEGDRVSSGQTVALLYSPTFVTAQNDLLQALRRARAVAGTEDERGAASIVDAARRRLRSVGAGTHAIARLEAGGEPTQYMALAAPFAGSIMQASALVGEAVEAGQDIFKIADLSVVDVVAEIPERALPFVRIGQAASIEIAAYPGMRFAGRVERLRDELNPETRTVRAVIHALNGSGRLRPGMFATVSLRVPNTALAPGSAVPRGSALITIPESAVVTDGELRYVFAEVGPRTFERREVEIASLAPPGSATPGGVRVAVRSGLVRGDRVVVRGAFILKSELAKAGLGEHGH